jgi:hypothetical protein
VEIKSNEETKQLCLLNNEEWRLSEGEKVLGKTNANTPPRDWCPEGK